jgi:FkbM family methyltransferase
MNAIQRAIHKIVLNSKTEELFVTLRRNASVIRKFVPVSWRHKFTSFGRLIPQSSYYPKHDQYFLTRDDTHFKINRSDYVQWRIFYGVRDNALREAKKYLTPGSIVLDIGANFGAFSLKLATYINQQQLTDVHVHAFEPNPVVYDNYTTNLELNPSLKSMVTVHPVGLGSESGEKPFDYVDSNTGAGRVVEKSEGANKVKIERLDDFIKSLNPTKIAFIKLIVEGFEPQVLEGGWETIKKYRPPIFFEVTPEWWKENNATVEDVLDKLKTLGYHFMIEHFNEMLPYEPEKYADRIQFNLLATRR